MRYYGSVPTGDTVWHEQSGAYKRSQYPYLGGTTDRSFNDDEYTSTPGAPGLLDAQEAYLGGHTYEISNSEALQLIVAGYQDRLNIADVEVTWKNEDLPHLFISNMSQSAPPIDVPANPYVDESQRGVFGYSAGDPITSGGRRDYWLHEYVSFADIEAETVLDPVSYDGPEGAHQQGGLVLRYVESGGKKRGVTINNNVFFVVPFINVGVWEANLDGTGFINRQYSFGIDSLSSPAFPSRLQARLTGNIAQVRVAKINEPYQPWSNDLTSYARSKAINLDTDAGDSVTIPTPTGKGGAGWIVAHMGTNPAAWYRFRRTTFKNRDVT